MTMIFNSVIFNLLLITTVAGQGSVRGYKNGGAGDGDGSRGYGYMHRNGGNMHGHGGDSSVGCWVADLRFNKVEFLNGNKDKYANLYPLGRHDYPISLNDDVVTMLKNETNGVSVVDERDDYELTYNVAELLAAVGGIPDYPSCTTQLTPFWNDLKHVIQVRNLPQNARADGALKGEFQLPESWKNYTVAECAEAVHDEYIGLHQAKFIENLLSNNYGPPEFDYEVIPRRSQAQFLHGPVMLADLNTWTPKSVGPYNFCAKWFVGMPRPEEVVWAIKNKQDNYNLHSNVPQEIINLVSTLGISKAEEFTAYPEGSPNHPSFPAMHSAASNASFWLNVVLNLSKRQLCEAKKVDYAVAFARTVAGVHYQIDNIAGLKMGQEVVRRVLAEYLVTSYGSDIDIVNAKVEAARFDWDEYDPLEPCNDD